MKRNNARRRFSTSQEVFEALVSGELTASQASSKSAPTSNKSSEYKQLFKDGLLMFQVWKLKDKLKGKLKKLEQEGYE